MKDTIQPTEEHQRSYSNQRRKSKGNSKDSKTKKFVVASEKLDRRIEFSQKQSKEINIKDPEVTKKGVRYVMKTSKNDRNYRARQIHAETPKLIAWGDGVV